ncbi:MAG: hypothetical protein HC905_12990, partial [Bacteroidales bacterium]|nr:hypothetical protein [Bacteroidales bacterium]
RSYMPPAFYSGANNGNVMDTSSAIRKYRMRDIEIQLFDNVGKPLKNVLVEVTLQKHAFLFGDCNPEMDSMFRRGPAVAEKLDVYRKVFASALNAVNSTCYWTERPRNNMAKTEAFQGEYKLDGFANTVDWGNANGLTVKGHPLFWTVPKAVPDWMSKYDYETQMKFLEVRLRSLVGRFKGKVKLWDAVNEMLWEPALKNLTERNWPHIETLDNMAGYISFVLRICREEDPAALFLLNDYGLEKDHNAKPQLQANDNDPNAANEAGLRSKDGTLVNASLQRKRYLELVKRLKDMGYPPSAIGMQGHSGAVTADEQISLYDEMAQAGLPLHVTEFWAHPADFGEDFRKLPKTEQELRIAAYVKQFITNAFAHPAIESFFFWGFMGMATEWHEGDAPVYSEKPTLNAVRDLIKKEWQTNEKLTTNGDGIVKLRGFYGDYQLKYLISNKIQDLSPFPFVLGNTKTCHTGSN